jgi:hypothetical protein
MLASPAVSQTPDFLFGKPTATLSVMTGWSMPGEGSDVFTATRSDVTVRRGDFASVPVRVGLAIHLSERLDWTMGFEYAGRSVEAEWREWVWMDDSPIYQTAEFKRSRLETGFRAYLFPRGRLISEFAWIPGDWSPYLGAGGAVTWYDFTRRGDFVVSEPGANEGEIFGDRVTSTGHGLTPWAAAGVDVTLSPHLLLRLESRQYWGTGDVDRRAYEGYNDIDLSGTSLTIGFAVRVGGRGI